VILIPKGEQVHGQGWEQTLRDYKKMQSMSWDLDKPTRRIVNFLEMNKVATLNLLPDMRSYAEKSGETLYFDRRGHWNREGHRLTAELILNYLQTSQIVP